MSQLSHPSVVDGWFSEVSEKDFPGQSLMLQVEKILYVGKSEFQDILVFQSMTYGNVLVLDGIVQATERDEFAYQEMITHLSIMSHADPKRVLVIGGGDGGVLREVLKHKSIEKVHLVEIDETVISLSKKYLPHMAQSFKDPKVEVFLQDGFKFLENLAKKSLEEKYDVIITDSSDPDGPAEAFFQENYFRLLENSVTESGVVISQASENFWLRLDNLFKLSQTCRKVFPSVSYGYVTIPTYTSGQLGLMVCCKDPKVNLKVPSRSFSIKEESTLFKYYNSEIHRACYVMPTWAEGI